MPITHVGSDSYQISGPDIDRISLVFLDFEAGKGQVIMTQWDDSWACWFGAMGEERKIREFFCACGVDYLLNKLSNPKAKRVEIGRLEKAIKRAKQELGTIMETV